MKTQVVVGIRKINVLTCNELEAAYLVVAFVIFYIIEGLFSR